MKYIPTIGIEVHVELKTNTKLFSSSLNEYGKMANSLTNEIDLGYPGTLPTVNKEVINNAIKAAHILNCSIQDTIHFDRKNYFYPDNSKNYQITQNKTPIGTNGYININIDGNIKKIYINEMHIEEDTCKSTHKSEKTLLDFNRSGVPLIEIVTTACMSSSKEAVLYLEKLKELLFYSDISNCKMEEGSMRCDANISLRKNENDPLGVKCEVKNIGSISNVGLAIEKEIVRQTKMLDNNETFKEQTRRFDEKLQDTILMRVKETGNDYRYFPEPDIPYINITEEMKDNAIKEIPMLPDERRKLYLDNGVNELNSNKLIQNRDLSDFFNNLVDKNIDLKVASNLLLGDISAYLNKTNKEITDTKLTIEKMAELTIKITSNEITNKNVKEILIDVMESDNKIEKIIKDANISNIVDNSFIKEIISKIINDNPESVQDYQMGKDRAIKYLMGQVMKETKGSVNPKVANQLLLEELTKLVD